VGVAHDGDAFTQRMTGHPTGVVDLGSLHGVSPS
jgi:hypothetical protein